MTISFLVASLLGILPYVCWGLVFYLMQNKKIRSPILWVFIFTLKILVIGAIIYLTRNIITSNFGYFFLIFSTMSLGVPFIFNKILFLVNS